jgi:NTE family protein
MYYKVKVGLALGGGAVRGLAHLGVLQTLEKYDIPVDLIAGTSIGAVVGSMYAIDSNAEQITKRTIDYFKGDDFKGASLDFMSHKKDEKRGIVSTLLDKVTRSLRKSFFYGISLTNISYMSHEVLARSLSYLIPDLYFRHCKIPFSCCTTDLRTGKYFYYDEGPLQKAILASCSIPGLFPPVEMDGKLLIDGSWADQNPVRRAREMGADFVIAVHIVHDEHMILELNNSLDVVMAGNQVTKRTLANLQLTDADIVICPDTKDVHWANFAETEACINQGIEDTEKAMGEIKRRLRRARIKKFFTAKAR